MIRKEEGIDNNSQIKLKKEKEKLRTRNFLVVERRALNSPRVVKWFVIREVRHFRDLIVELTIAFRIPTKPALQRYTVMMGVDTNWGRESKGPIDRQHNTDLILSNGQKPLRAKSRELYFTRIYT